MRERERDERRDLKSANNISKERDATFKKKEKGFVGIYRYHIMVLNESLSYFFFFF